MDKIRKEQRVAVINSTLDYLQNDEIKCLSYDGKRVNGVDKNVFLLNVGGHNYLLGFEASKSGKSIANGITSRLKMDKVKSETILATMVDSAS